jgi:hypothetical protein
MQKKKPDVYCEPRYLEKCVWKGQADIAWSFL